MRIASAEPRGAAFPWLQLWLTTATLVLVFIFHWKWTRPISSYPLELPKIKYTFVERPEFYQFDEATQERWHASMSEKWWKTRWRAPDGGDSVRVFSMFHRIHCLTALREEFTLLTTDPKRHESFYAENDDKTGSRLHLGHCFDLLRQACNNRGTLSQPSLIRLVSCMLTIK